MKEFREITFGELLEIKKIMKMTFKEAMPKMQELRDKYGFTDTQTKNLVCIARDFKPKLVCG